MAKPPAGARGSSSTPFGERPWVVRSQRIAVIGAVVVVVLVALAVPARSYVAQRAEIAAQNAKLDELTQRNDELQEQRDRLDDPEEIQRIARRDYGLVLSHEESYAILPSPTAGLVLPRSWPFDVLSAPLEKVASGRP
ncbi:MAG TPA: septum formation initiator family protein [Microthrixaceae bacterium]|nr:septum formation initiator family protein [Microthrixaceae bacterium]